MTIRKMFLSLLAGILLGYSAISGSAEVCEPFQKAPVPPSILDTMLKAADDGYLYRIDTHTSKVTFCVKHFPFSEVRGDFGEFTGGLALRARAGDNSQALVLIKTGSLDTRNQGINALAKGPEFFDISSYPEILFVSTGFQWTTETSGKLSGNLSLHGETRPVTFDVEIAPPEDAGASEQDRIIVRAGTEINRTDFGMSSLRLLVGDRVRLCLEVQARRFQA